MDSFIERSNALFVARPETARVSIRYTHRKVLHGEDATVSGGRPGAAIVKTYDPVSGSLFKIRVTKANELSRILSSLGPRTIELTRPSDIEGEPVVVRKRGLASLMSDTEFADDLASPVEATGQTTHTPAAASQEDSATSKKDPKKKKSKKK